ncbi:DDE transposase, partial [bacterium]|nr:DDE transposase [bacterium]
MFEENNKHRQKKLISFLNNLPPSVQKIIQKSWAKPFYEHIFCKIDESKFKEMYSEKGSRPNKPANILIGLEIIKQLFNYTDDE